MNTSKQYSYILTICGLIGLLAAFWLTVDTIKYTEDPSINLPCNINPFISCTNAIKSSQGNVFGFPNPLLGIVGFSAITTVGVLLLFGLTNPPSQSFGSTNNFWKIFAIGSTLSIIFVHWFIYESIYVLGSLCLYCMVTWAVTWPIFIYTITSIYDLGFVKRNRLTILIGWYLLIILLILIRFREFFIS